MSFYSPSSLLSTRRAHDTSLISNENHSTLPLNGPFLDAQSATRQGRVTALNAFRPELNGTACDLILNSVRLFPLSQWAAAGNGSWFFTSQGSLLLHFTSPLYSLITVLSSGWKEFYALWARFHLHPTFFVASSEYPHIAELQRFRSSGFVLAPYIGRECIWNGGEDGCEIG